MTRGQLVVLTHLARRVCAADREGVVTSDEVDVVGFVDAYVARMPARTRRDLTLFLGLIEHVAPLRIGALRRFSRLPPADQDRVLAALESSPVSLFGGRVRGAFAGLKALLFMGYYRDPRTWPAIGYPGPAR